MLNIGKKDREILYHLDLDVRKPIRKIAREVNLPENTLRYRIKKLEDKQIIKRYYTAINSYNLGFKVIKFYTNYVNINSIKQNEIINFFSNLSNTWVVSSKEGEFDLGVIFWIKNINTFYPIWKKIFSSYANYLTDSQLFFQCEALSFHPTYLINTQTRSENELFDYTLEEKEITIDSIDVKILNYLASEAKIPLSKLSQYLNLTGSSIINRMNRLKKNNIIQSYRIEIDVAQFGFLHVKTDVFLNNLQNIKQAIAYFRHCPYVICIMKSFGYSHIEIEFHVKNLTHFHQIMMDFMDRNPNIIKNYKFFQTSKTHKLRWIPEMKNSLL
jgi:DNA-binding Lrp family transcriptional regulator